MGTVAAGVLVSATKFVRQERVQAFRRANRARLFEWSQRCGCNVIPAAAGTVRSDPAASNGAATLKDFSIGSDPRLIEAFELLIGERSIPAYKEKADVLRQAAAVL